MSVSEPRWDSMGISERAPKRAPSLAEQAYETLREWIVAGDLAPAAPLSENDLARRFSISRSPLREAIRRLQDEKLLEPSGPRGFSVPPLGVELVRDVYGVRRALETAAAETADAIPPGEVGAMRDRLTMQAAEIRKGNLGPFNDGDFDFHDLYVAHCGNRLLIGHLHRLRGNIRRIIAYAGQFQGHTEASLEEHLVIMSAVEAGDTAVLRSAVDSHIRGVTDRLVATFEAAS
ncbi:GntR family transcriptional regulator [Pseudonocardia sp. GCM10023141]|uniref:GntR family transcriptional regulator n=1 Tax=Pseudonocardia sp. GCM10023141 TaxID=3252653 RepID=UPI0036169C29